MMILLHAALWMLVPLAHNAPPKATKADLQPVASAYAGATGLPALNTRADFELRVWVRDYMSGHVFGEVVADGQLRILRTNSTFKDDKLVIQPASLGTPSPVEDVRRLEELVSQLEPRNGRTVTCPVFDGGSVLVDAVLHGRVITVQIDNPNFCTDAPSKALTRLLAALDHQAALHCNTGELRTVGGPWVTGFWRVEDNEDDDASGEILQFRSDGTVAFYDGDFEPDDHDAKKTYRIDDGGISVTVSMPDAPPVTLLLHASKDRKTLTPTTALLGMHATLKRITDHNCITQSQRTR